MTKIPLGERRGYPGELVPPEGPARGTRPACPQAGSGPENPRARSAKLRVAEKL